MDCSSFIADRVAEIGASGIRRVFDLGATLKDPINLSIGQPDYSVPEVVKRAMVDAILADHNGYTLTRGIAPLRERIATDLKQRYPMSLSFRGCPAGYFYRCWPA
jgi:aspartate aminotransferase/aminotransferase